MIAAVLADAMEGVIRTVIHSSDRYVFGFKAITHPSRQVFIGGFIEITTADAGLVGDDNDQPAQLVGPEASQFENSRDELELVRPVNVTTVNIDHASRGQEKVHSYAWLCHSIQLTGCRVLDSTLRLHLAQADGSVMSCARSFWSDCNSSKYVTGLAAKNDLSGVIAGGAW